MDKRELLDLIKKIIEDKGTTPKVATFVEVRHAAEGDKALLNIYFRELVAEKKIRVRPGMKSKLIEIIE